MNEADQILEDTAIRLFNDFFDTDALRRAEAGEWPASAWEALEATGLPLAFVAESQGGFGAVEAANLVMVAGRHSVPLPLAETLIANRLLSAAGLALPGGPLTIGPVQSDDALHLSRATEGWHLRGTAHRIPWGRCAGIVVLAQYDGRDYLASIPVGAARVDRDANLAREPRDTLHFDVALPEGAVALAPTGIGRASILDFGAALRSLAMAGALQRLVEITVAYAGERSQFGQPIGKFQAIQHNLAIMAGQAAAAVAAAKMVAEALDPAVDRLRVAIAKARTGEAVGKAVALAHQIHGAIGIAQEHPLHFLTTRLWSWRDEFGNEAGWNAYIGSQAVASARLWPFITAA